MKTGKLKNGSKSSCDTVTIDQNGKSGSKEAKNRKMQAQMLKFSRQPNESESHVHSQIRT